MSDIRRPVNPLMRLARKDRNMVETIKNARRRIMEYDILVNHLDYFEDNYNECTTFKEKMRCIYNHLYYYVIVFKEDYSMDMDLFNLIYDVIEAKLDELFKENGLDLELFKEEIGESGDWLDIIFKSMDKRGR